MCMWVHVHMCTRVKARGQHWMFSSIVPQPTSSLLFLVTCMCSCVYRCPWPERASCLELQVLGTDSSSLQEQRVFLYAKPSLLTHSSCFATTFLAKCGAQQFCYACWLVSSWDSPVTPPPQHWEDNHVLPQLAFIWVRDQNLGSPIVRSRNFIEWAISLALPLPLFKITHSIV